MITFFDYVTVVGFLGLVVAYFVFTDQEPYTLWRFMFSAIVLAVANQLGNSGFAFFAIILVAAGLAFAAISLRRAK